MHRLIISLLGTAVVLSGAATAAAREPGRAYGGRGAFAANPSHYGQAQLVRDEHHGHWRGDWGRHGYYRGFYGGYFGHGLYGGGGFYWHGYPRYYYAPYSGYVYAPPTYPYYTPYTYYPYSYTYYPYSYTYSYSPYSFTYVPYGYAAYPDYDSGVNFSVNSGGGDWDWDWD